MISAAQLIDCVAEQWRKDAEAVAHSSGRARQRDDVCGPDLSRDATGQNRCRNGIAADCSQRFSNPGDLAIEQRSHCLRGDVGWREASASGRQDNLRTIGESIADRSPNLVHVVANDAS
jgi:hypothetical protein